MTEQELLNIENRLKAASEGPWTVVPGKNLRTGEEADEAEIRMGDEQPDFRDTKYLCCENGWIYKPNAEFVANARQDVPRMLEEIRTLREHVRMLRGALEGIAAMDTHYDIEAASDRAAAALKEWDELETTAPGGEE